MRIQSLFLLMNEIFKLEVGSGEGVGKELWSRADLGLNPCSALVGFESLSKPPHLRKFQFSHL